MKFIALPIAARRTPRSLDVNAPSLNAGCPNRLVVAIPTPRPVSSSAALKRATILSFSACVLPSGIRSSSWSETPHAPSSASLYTESTGSIGSRVGPPNGSRPGFPTVHRPNVKRCRERGSTAPSATLGSSTIDTLPPAPEFVYQSNEYQVPRRVKAFDREASTNLYVFVTLSDNLCSGSGQGRLAVGADALQCFLDRGHLRLHALAREQLADRGQTGLGAV